MVFDLVFVTYNSAKWVDKCFDSLKQDEFFARQLHIYVVDNASTDNTVTLLKEYRDTNLGSFASFDIIEENRNWGFGKANNIGFAAGKSDIVCFFNIDTEVFSDTFYELEKAINRSEEDVAVWELRQFPYEHPKMYDPLTGETTWVSGAAFSIRRDVYAGLGGFDEQLFMYAEDVDLSWRIRMEGYKLKYVPRVKITHYSYENAGELKPNQHVYSVINNILLRYRFGAPIHILMGHVQFFKLLMLPSAFPGAKGMLLREYFKHFGKIGHFLKGRKRTRKEIANFSNWDYSAIRDGAFYKNVLPSHKPLVSIIVRTCGRPNTLRETLISLRNQTYDNIQIVIVEDGKNISEKMIKEEFADLNIIYRATIDKVGRCKTGNLAMSLADGEYLNFLDDDDLFYADHVEVLVELLMKENNLAAYATAFETPIRVITNDPYKYEIKDYLGVHKQAYNKIILCHHNYIPIQCIMFSKSLFEKYGGLDESVDALEDWDMWVRYSLHTDFSFVLKTTSIYRVPADAKTNKKRQDVLDETLKYMRKKHKGYMQSISVYDICKMYEDQDLKLRFSRNKI